MAVNKMAIEGRVIGEGHAPYIIAEMSANHNGSIENALRLIEVAKQCGADAVKLQTYRADTITIKSDHEDFQIHGGLWDGKNLYQLYESAYTPWEWHKDLFAKAKQEGITIFSSPFDTTAVDLLEDLNAPAYKIASFEMIDIPLIRYIASTKKPVIMSTGMASLAEIEESLDVLKTYGSGEIVVLHCVSGYPAPAEQYQLKTIADMQHRLGVPIGLSDHTLNNTAALVAVALGACVIEKHFTLDRTAGGPDDSFSLEPAGLLELCVQSKMAWQALGTASYERAASEQGNIKFRRSLYVVAPIKCGEYFTVDNVRSIRPGLGLAPKHLDDVVGKKARVDLAPGTRMSWDVVA